MSRSVRDAAGVLLSFWTSLTIAWVASGARLSSRDFWIGGWFYGLPLFLLLPVYSSIFKRLPHRALMRSMIGVALTPIPIALLLSILVAIGVPRIPRTGLPLTWDYLVWLYIPWYAMFGAFLGASTALARTPARP